MTKLGFICTFTNNYLYIKQKKERIVLFVLIYINNIAVNGPDSQFIILFRTALSNDFETTNLSELKFILEILVFHNHIKYLIFFNQLAYIHQVLACFGMQNIFPVLTSLVVKYKLSTF